MAFKDFLKKRKVGDDRFLNEFYGSAVDLRRKREVGKSEYYATDSTAFEADFTVPVDLEDLQGIKLDYPKLVRIKTLVGAKEVGKSELVGGKVVERRLSEAEVRKRYCREGFIETGLGRFKLLDWQVESLVKKYPRRCRRCGYSRFHYLHVEQFAVGTEAGFKCPYCGKETELNWRRRW